MAQTCGQCGSEVYRTTFSAARGLFVGHDCGCLRGPRIHDVDSPFADGQTLTLDHIHDERGNKVTVSSVRQLREAENRHGFVHFASNMGKKEWSNVPQQRQYSVGELYRRKFQRGTI